MSAYDDEFRYYDKKHYKRPKSYRGRSNLSSEEFPFKLRGERGRDYDTDAWDSYNAWDEGRARRRVDGARKGTKRTKRTRTSRRPKRTRRSKTRKGRSKKPRKTRKPSRSRFFNTLISA